MAICQLAAKHWSVCPDFYAWALLNRIQEHAGGQMLLHPTSWSAARLSTACKGRAQPYWAVSFIHAKSSISAICRDVWIVQQSHVHFNEVSNLDWKISTGIFSCSLILINLSVVMNLFYTFKYIYFEVMLHFWFCISISAVLKCLWSSETFGNIN